MSKRQWIDAGTWGLLHQAAGPQSQLWLIDDFGHIQAATHPDYAERLRRFFARDDGPGMRAEHVAE